ncbi:MAG TPA: MoaD/ThiS family protein [Thermoanaerobaculia bacterium]|jgi:molybdopterin converting factor subunit 1|nr:MoaD/ThiS family protein [Thermoanaerobaculia bacterium]
MQVRVLYFASFRDAAGRKEEPRELPEGSRVEDLWTDLARSVPAFSRFPTIPPAAVNREYVAPDTILAEGDEVAFLPPVAGG